MMRSVSFGSKTRSVLIFAMPIFPFIYIYMYTWFVNRRQGRERLVRLTRKRLSLKSSSADHPPPECAGKKKMIGISWPRAHTVWAGIHYIRNYHCYNLFFRITIIYCYVFKYALYEMVILIIAVRWTFLVVVCNISINTNEYAKIMLLFENYVTHLLHVFLYRI